MKIKKVDDKPMVIHKKKDMKLHEHEPKKASIKATGIYTTERVSEKRSKRSAVKEYQNAKKCQGKRGAVAQLEKVSLKEETKTDNRKSNASKPSLVSDTVSQSAPPNGNQKAQGFVSKYKNSRKERNQSVKVKNTSLRSVGMVGAKTVSDQMDGGQEVQQSAMIMHEVSKPVTGITSKGSRLFREKVIKQQKLKIKRVDAGSKIGKKSVKETSKKAAKETAKKATKGTAKKVAKETTKKTAKETAKTTAKVAAKTATTAATTAAGTAISPGLGTVIGYAAGEVVGAKIEHQDMVNDNRMRKIRFFLDKMKSEGEQTDSFAKMVKDLIFRRAGLMVKQVMSILGPFLLVLVLVIIMIAVPVVAVVGVMYNSPFAIFLPPLEAGDTVTSMTSSYVTTFNQEVSDLATNHTGYDDGRIEYVDYEGAGTPNNFYDILAVYMVKHGVGETATIMNDTTKDWLQDIVDDMCTYTTEMETTTHTQEHEDGTTSEYTTTCLVVKVKLKTWHDMVTEYGFDSNEQELLADFMKPENLALLGTIPGAGGAGAGGGAGGGAMQSALSQEEINAALSGIVDSTQRTICSFVLNRVGYPYSQALRDSGEYYDCSSLAYYAWRSAGVNISYGGATTAAAEAQGLNEAGKATTFEAMRPGDLIFYSTQENGRYMNITHVAVYVGNGKVVEALNETYGVVYQNVRTNNIVLICSPN